MADLFGTEFHVWKERAHGAPEPDFSRMNTGNDREALQALEVELLSV